MKQRLFRDREAWRAWLRENHASSTGLWLVYYKKHTGRKSIAYDEGVEEALCYGWIDSTVRRIDDEKYKQQYTPRKPKSNWSGTNKKRVARLIKEKRMTAAGLKAIDTAKKNGSWDRLHHVDTDPIVPADLALAFSKNSPANKFFQGLAPSYQKQYLWWLKSAKRPETRKKRLAAIIDRCHDHLKPGM